MEYALHREHVEVPSMDDNFPCSSLVAEEGSLCKRIAMLEIALDGRMNV